MDDLDPTLEMSPEELKEFRRRIKRVLDMLPLHPHQRLGIPPCIKGKDIESDVLTVQTTSDFYVNLKKN